MSTTLERLPKSFGIVGSIREDERRDVYGAFLTLLGFMAGHAMLETARDALFLAELSASLLPWVYLILAASALLLTRYHSQLARFLPAGLELASWLLFASLTSAALWMAIFWAGDWIYYALYAWTGVLATLVVIRFWAMLGNIFTVTQAKRLFAIVGTGSILGAILGSGLASALSTVLPAQHLVLLAAFSFFLASIAPRLMQTAQSHETELARQTYGAPDLGHVARLVLARPYLKRIALAILLATVSFTLVDYVFKSTTARLVPDENLGTFFSTTYFSLNLLSLIIQVTTVSWLLRRVAVSTALAIVPLLLFAGALGFVIAGGLALAVLLKGIDGSLRYSLYRTTMELLYVPISADLRGRVKTFIDLLGQRGGQAIGSILVLVVLSITTNEIVVAIVAAFVIGAWLYLILGIKPYYLELFRETLREDLTTTRIEFPALDVASLETLIYTLNSADDRQVIAALDLLAAQSRIKLVPGLILYHPSSEVLIHALGVFAEAGRTDVLPLIDRLTANPDERVRAAAIRARTTLASEHQMLDQAAEDPAAVVRATAAIAQVALGRRRLDEVQGRLDDLLGEASPAVLLAIAETIRILPSPEFEALLLRLEACEDTDVRLATVRAMHAARDSAFIRPLSQMLAQRPLRSDARAALVDLGPEALSGLAEELADTSLPHGVRRHLPHTIAAFGSPQAASILLRHLLEEGDGMIRFKVLRALGRMRSMNSSLLLDLKTIRQSIDQNLESAFRYMHWKNVLAARTRYVAGSWAEYHRLLIDLLEDKQAHTLQRLFRLLNLYANDDEFLRIYRGLHSARREARASSRELIEHLVEADLARPILILIDDLLESPPAAPAESLRGADAEWQRTLAELFGCGVESLASLAALEIGRLRLTGLRDMLASATVQSESQADVITQALERLEAPA